MRKEGKQMTGYIIDKVRELSREKAQDTILEMIKFLSDDQCGQLQTLIEKGMTGSKQSETITMWQRMSQNFVDEKMNKHQPCFFNKNP